MHYIHSIDLDEYPVITIRTTCITSEQKGLQYCLRGQPGHATLTGHSVKRPHTSWAAVVGR